MDPKNYLNWKAIIVFALLNVIIFTISGVRGSDTGQLVKVGSCSCPEDIITYHCIVNAPGRGGFTIWRGTAFNCPAVQNRVLLRHNSYETGSGAFGQCGDAIVGRSVRVDSPFVYVSQLVINITANPELIGRTVECVYNPSGDTIIPINSTTIAVEEPLPSPTNVRLTGVSVNGLDFTWTPAQTDCSTRYVITSDCGNCAMSSTLQAEQPMASCSFQPPSTADRECTLSVQSVICGNLSSATSAPVSVNLRVPRQPTIHGVVPVYQMKDSRGLQSAIVNFTEVESFDISNGVDGSPLYYTLEVSDSISGVVCVRFNATPSSSCQRGVCVVTLDDLASCLSGTEIIGTVTISVVASNWLGNGQSSSVVIDKSSQDVVVNFETPTRVVCTYTEHTLNKSCDISYGSCDQSVATYTTVQGRVNSSTTVNIELSVGIAPGDCYVVNASSSNSLIAAQFRGTYDDPSQRSTSTGVVVAIVIVVLLIVFVVLVSVAVLVVIVHKKRMHVTHFIGQWTIGSKDLESHVSLLKIGAQCVYAHISFTIEDELKELVRVLQILSSDVNIKNLKICQCEDELDHTFKKTVYIENEHNFSDEEVEKIRNLIKSGLPHDTSVCNQAQSVEQIPEDKEHDRRNLRTITETLKHTPGALCSLLETFEKIEECRHINITDITHEEVEGQKNVRNVTIKFYPDLPRNWKQKFDRYKIDCEYIELSQDSKKASQKG